MATDSTISVLRDALEAARATRRQPSLLAAYRDLGAAYLAAGRVDEAESALRTSIQQARVGADSRQLGLSLLLLARTLARTARTDRALLAYTEAVSALQGHPEAEAAAAELKALSGVPGGAR